VQLSLHAVLERVTAYDEAGDRSRALTLCRKALVVWEREPKKVPEAWATLAQVVGVLESE
jgi:hypothetical protein